MGEINCRVPPVTNFNSAAHVKVELRKEFQAQEAALQRSLSKLRSELQKAQEEARENRDKTNRLQTSLANAEGTIKVNASGPRLFSRILRFMRVLVIKYSFFVSLELAQAAGGGHPGWRDLGDATEGHRV